MSSIQAELAIIGQRLIDEFRGAIAGKVTSSQLQETVRDLTLLMKRAGFTPEGAIVRVKTAAFDAGAGPAQQDVFSMERHNTLALTRRLVGWTIDAYFRDGSGGNEREQDRSIESR